MTAPPPRGLPKSEPAGMVPSLLVGHSNDVLEVLEEMYRVKGEA